MARIGGAPVRRSFGCAVARGRVDQERLRSGDGRDRVGSTECIGASTRLDIRASPSRVAGWRRSSPAAMVGATRAHHRRSRSIFGGLRSAIAARRNSGDSCRHELANASKSPHRDGGKRRRGGCPCSSLSHTDRRGVTDQRGMPVTDAARTIADLRLAARTKGCSAAISPRELRRAIRQATCSAFKSRGATARIGHAASWRAFFAPMQEARPSDTRGQCARSTRSWSISSGETSTWSWKPMAIAITGGSAAFEDDRQRDLRLKSLGYEVLRLSYRQVQDEPAARRRRCGVLLNLPPATPVITAMF